MNVVVICVVAEQVLEGIPRKCESAVIVDRLCRRDAKEQDVLSDREPGNHVCEKRAASVENETLDRVVIQSTERVRDV